MMGTKLKLITIVNRVLYILFCVHICFGWLTDGLLLAILFPEICYVPVIALGIALQCYWSADLLAGRNKIYQYAGAALLLIMAMVVAASMFLKPFDHGNQGLICYGCGDKMAGYFIPILTAAGLFQLFYKWKSTNDNFARYTLVFNLVVLLAFIARTTWYVILGLIRQPELFDLSISSIFYIPFVPVLFVGNIAIWMAKQIKETVA